MFVYQNHAAAVFLKWKGGNGVGRLEKKILQINAEHK